MFPDLQLEVMDRFTALEQYFRNSPKQPDKLAQMAKGMVFVQVYAIYEYTAKSAMRLAIAEIANHGHRYADLRAGLLAIFLDPAVMSLRDGGNKKPWESRLELFEQCVSGDPISAVDVIPNDGSHFKHTQIILMLRALGVKRSFTRRKRHLYTIDEIVNHRHVIAHGGDTAIEIGRRYSRGHILEIIRLMQKICLRLIAIVSEHCSLPDRHCR
jgi:hypothetical protein